jgi:hypothetical protein
VTDQSIKSERERWALLVGRLVLSFGDIEFHLLQCLVHVPAQNLYGQYRDKEFVAKANKAIEVLRGSTIKPQRVKKLVSLVNKAIKCAKNRNLIAHNPLRLAIYSSGIGNLDFRPEIRSLRNQERFLTLPELEALASESEALAGQFYEALNGALFNM